MIVWDVGSGEAVNVIDCHPDVIFSMSFNRDGSLIATTCKDKKLRVIEPRRGIVLSEGVCHAGTKACKVVFLGNSGRLLSTGFSRYSDRQYAVWSQSDLSAPLCIETIDSSSGVLFPYYDHDTRIVFLAGKEIGQQEIGLVFIPAGRKLALRANASAANSSVSNSEVSGGNGYAQASLVGMIGAVSLDCDMFGGYLVTCGTQTSWEAGLIVLCLCLVQQERA
uniref:Uncharacterized protein n=1 Tax=Timema douglasi TaxID=61478 RepID=A0A7R8VZ39_TIMDO|nr:unnamed protein product [Timema douglasi]